MKVTSIVKQAIEEAVNNKASAKMENLHKIKEKLEEQQNADYAILKKDFRARYEKIVEEKPKLGYEFQLLDVSQRITPMNVLKVDNLQWYEIDDAQDLKYAEENINIK